jgi:hypothetical protein
MRTRIQLFTSMRIRIPDPAPHQGDVNLRLLADPPGLHFERPRPSTAPF